MKWTLFSILCVLVMLNPVGAAEKTNLVFHVQLVRASDQVTPPTKDSRLIGPKLGAQFHRIFAWKYFWEIQYQKVPVAPGQKVRVRLNAQREAEIDLGTPGKRAVTAHSDGKVMSRSIEHVDAPMTIIGGDRDRKSGWFIVVRRDKPAID